MILNMRVDLKKIASYLKDTHVQLELNYFVWLLRRAAKTFKPHTDRLFATKLGCKFNNKVNSAMGIRGWISGKRTIRFSQLMKLIQLANVSHDDVQRKIVFIKAAQHNGEIYPKFPIPVGGRLGSIAGHILGDGSIDRKYHQVFFSNTNVELLKEFREAMLIVFGIEPRIWTQTTNGFGKKNSWTARIYNLNEKKKTQSVGLFYPTICGILLHALLGRFADGENKSVSKQIKRAPIDFKRAFLRAFFDDEGNVSINSQGIRLFQDSKSMLGDIKILLNEFGIHCNPTHFYARRNKKHYYFNITHINNYYRFYHEIGFTSSYKQNDLKQLIQHVTASRKYKNLVLPRLSTKSCEQT